MNFFSPQIFICCNGSKFGKQLVFSCRVPSFPNSNKRLYFFYLLKSYNKLHSFGRRKILSFFLMKHNQLDFYLKKYYFNLKMHNMSHQKLGTPLNSTEKRCNIHVAIIKVIGNKKNSFFLCNALAPFLKFTKCGKNRIFLSLKITEIS